MSSSSRSVDESTPLATENKINGYGTARQHPISTHTSKKLENSHYSNYDGRTEESRSEETETDELLPRERQPQPPSYQDSHDEGQDDQHNTPSKPQLSPWRANFTIATLSIFTLFSSMTTGLLIISITKIQDDLNVPESLLLWPASIYFLVMGCLLLLSGSLADFIGYRKINLLGTFILGASLVVASLSHDAPQLIIFRGFQGLGASMSFPTAVSMLSHSFPQGKRRSIAFGFLGLGQPLGFCLGLVLGGVFETHGGGWRAGFQISGGVVVGITFINIWLLPQERAGLKKFSVRRLRKEIDWIGVAISSTCLGLLSYILAILSDDASTMAKPINIVLLVICILLMPTFVYWMHIQRKNNRRPLIPNSLWREKEFSCICIMVLLAWGVIESMDLFFSLFFQTVQHLQPLDASIRFIPSAATGVGLNVFVGVLVYKFHMGRLVTLLSLLTVGSPLIMALIDPEWSYWYAAFWSSALGPLACDGIFTVANLVTTRTFAEDMQGLAGAVFNTIAQIGGSLGIAIMASVNATAKQRFGGNVPDRSDEELLMVGYRAVWWADTAMMVTVVLVGAWGLRRLGKMES